MWARWEFHSAFDENVLHLSPPGNYQILIKPPLRLFVIPELGFLLGSQRQNTATAGLRCQCADLGAVETGFVGFESIVSISGHWESGQRNPKPDTPLSWLT